MRPKFCLKHSVIFICLFLLACTSPPVDEKEPLSSFIVQADALAAERSYAEAVKILEEAAEIHPVTPVALNKIGQIYLKQHRWLLAQDAFNRALTRDSGNALALAGLAEATLNQGDTLKAIEFWQQAIEADPTLPGVFSGLGRTYLLNQNFEAAKDAFLYQQIINPTPDAQWYLAALEAPQNFEIANAYLLNFPADAPAEMLALRDYLLATLVPFTAQSSQTEVAKATGTAMVQAGHWPLAIYALTIAQNKMADMSPQEQAETLAFLGHALAQAGKPALDLFDQARQLDPTSALPLYFYGIYLRQQNAFGAAKQSFEQAIKLDPNNAAIYLELARTQTQEGLFFDAEVSYSAAIEIAEDSLPMQMALLRFYAGRGYKITEAGIPLAEEIIKADETNAEALDWLGWMQFSSGQPEAAEESFRRALEIEPDLVVARLHLARVLEISRPEDAVAEYQKVADWDISGTYRDQAMESLRALKVDR